MDVPCYPQQSSQDHSIMWMDIWQLRLYNANSKEIENRLYNANSKDGEFIVRIERNHATVPAQPPA